MSIQPHQLPEDTRLYHLEVRLDSGKTRRLTDYPMTHRECEVMKSKFSDWSQARIAFVEEPGAKADPDHCRSWPMANQEAALIREIKSIS